LLRVETVAIAAYFLALAVLLLLWITQGESKWFIDSKSCGAFQTRGEALLDAMTGCIFFTDLTC
jgi:hypothetical protein